LDVTDGSSGRSSGRLGSRLGGGDGSGHSGLADGAARLLAVLHHPSGVLGAFVLLGPFYALVSSVFGVFRFVDATLDEVILGHDLAAVFLELLLVDIIHVEGRAAVFKVKAGLAARLHAVGDHPFLVGSAFRLKLVTNLLTTRSPLLASVVLVGRVDETGAIVTLFGALAGLEGFLGTTADRAARGGAVGFHPLGVGGTFAGLGPARARVVGVLAVFLLGRTVGSLGDAFVISLLFDGDIVPESLLDYFKLISSNIC